MLDNVDCGFRLNEKNTNFHRKIFQYGLQMYPNYQGNTVKRKKKYIYLTSYYHIGDVTYKNLSRNLTLKNLIFYIKYYGEDEERVE